MASRLAYWKWLTSRFSQSIQRLSCKPPLSSRNTLSEKPPLLPADKPIEEEKLPFYIRQDYYPVHIGDIYQSRYEVVCKLGYGGFSTTWLCHDKRERNYKALKVSTASNARLDATRCEARIYKRLSTLKSDHPGQADVRSCYDTFELQSPSGIHQCLLQPAMHMSLADMLERHRAFDLPLLKMTLRRLLRALDFLHTEAQVTHLDMTVSNIMISIEDETMLQRCAEAELHDPTPRKVVDDTLTIYTSASLPDPKQGKYGVPVLCDFGQARIGESHKTGPLIQPHESRAPEVIFELPWGPSVDIWSVGCLAWALFEGKHLFQDVRTCSGHWKPYAHVAQIVGLIGAPPFQFIQKSKTSHECFDANGTWIHDNPRIPFTTLEDLEMRLDGSEQKKFLRFIRSMLTWLPNERKTAKELLEDPWLQALM